MNRCNPRPSTLSDRRVDLWLVLVEEAERRGLLPSYRELLDSEELEREKRFRRQQDRNRFVVSRALMRCTLSHYAPAPVDAWRFLASERGKPYLAPNPHFDVVPRFNLSHTDELVLMAVTLRHDVGVDAEHLARDLDSGVADQCLTTTERAACDALPFETRLHTFTEIWTLKEAYAKARGDGLFLPLHAFEFSFASPGQVCLRTADRIDDGRDWNFVQFRLPADHIGALCVAGADFGIALRRTLPLVAEDATVDPEIIRASATTRPGKGARTHKRPIGDVETPVALAAF
jgi:4'-phosphopantetheinyl transferase